MMSAKPARKPASKGKRAAGFTDEERAAMRERVRELNAGAGEGESAVLAKIGGMPQPDRALAERVHAIVKASAPGLAPRLWYGMPAYSKGGKVVCFFQPAHKFKSRYSTLGFSDKAHLDEGRMWPSSFALKDLTPAEEARVGALIKKAVG